MGRSGTKIWENEEEANCKNKILHMEREREEEEGGREEGKKRKRGRGETERNEQKCTDLFDKNQGLQPLSVKPKLGALNSYWGTLRLPYH